MPVKPVSVKTPTKKVTTMEENKLDQILCKLSKLEGLPGEVENINKKFDYFQQKIVYLEGENKKVAEEYKVMKERLLEMESKLDYQENLSRKNNLVFKGIPERDNGKERWEESKIVVIKTIEKELGVTLGSNDIERAYRVSKGSNPRNIVVHFSSYHVREQIFSLKKNIKNKQLIIMEDFSNRMLFERRKLVAEMKAAREQDMQAYVTRNKLYINGDLYMYDWLEDKVSLKQGKRVQVNNEKRSAAGEKAGNPSNYRLRSRAGSTKSTASCGSNSLMENWLSQGTSNSQGGDEQSK